ncbi:hypothetical protein Patl1_28431 [Pistacia atlantica]|uniref:Uncharacterized protein n=1 Tax=Pistacia atlantica TaxID=434234 RepID=A0ACC1BHA7_9ROSI|nr:hypothetical protein Patl1_28431 [Pistacia atlantica]
MVFRNYTDNMAVEIEKLISAHPEDDNGPAKEKKLGFILSYPVEQAASTSGSCHKMEEFCGWEKLVAEVNQALEKHGVNIRVYALVDDTIGNLAGGRYYDRETMAAVTVGRGTNAAYVESPQAVPKWEDAGSSNPGPRIFEKLTSGMYLGRNCEKSLTEDCPRNCLIWRYCTSKT